MTRALALLPALALIGLGASAPNESSAARKCGQRFTDADPRSNAPVYALDGAVIQPGTVGPMSNVRSDNIHSVEFICLNPKDSTFNRSSGVTIISIWTKTSPAPRVAEALEIVRQAQDAQFAKNGRYLSVAKEIPLPETMKGVIVTLEGGPSGWIARTTVPRLLRTCVMFDGTVADAPAGAPRKAKCEIDY
jgi:hypothetical protein